MGQRVTLSIPGPDGQDVNVSASNPLPISGGGTGLTAGQVQGNSAASTSDVGNPVKVGGLVKASLTGVVDGNRENLFQDAQGALWSVLKAPGLANPLSAIATNADGQIVGSINTRLEVVSRNSLFNGSSFDRDRKPNQTSRIVSAAATTNATVAKAGAGDLFRITGFNANAAARYLKIYNKATAPVVGTDTPVWTEYLPAQARFELSFPKGYYLSAGISYALTTGSADADTGALTAADILALNVAYA